MEAAYVLSLQVFSMRIASFGYVFTIVVVCTDFDTTMTDAQRQRIDWFTKEENLTDSNIDEMFVVNMPLDHFQKHVGICVLVKWTVDSEESWCPGVLYKATPTRTYWYWFSDNSIAKLTDMGSSMKKKDIRLITK